MYTVWGQCCGSSGVERSPGLGCMAESFSLTLVEEKRSLPVGEEHRDIVSLLHKTFSAPPEQRPTAKQVCIKSFTHLLSKVCMYTLVHSYLNVHKCLLYAGFRRAQTTKDSVTINVTVEHTMCIIHKYIH